MASWESPDSRRILAAHPTGADSHSEDSMGRILRCACLFVLASIPLPARAAAEEPRITTITSPVHVSYVRPQFLPPQALAEAMGVRFEGARGVLEWRDENGAHAVEVRRNDAANLLILSGASNEVAIAEGMVKGA